MKSMIITYCRMADFRYKAGNTKIKSSYVDLRKTYQTYHQAQREHSIVPSRSGRSQKGYFPPVSRLSSSVSTLHREKSSAADWVRIPERPKREKSTLNIVLPKVKVSRWRIVVTYTSYEHVK